VLVAGECERVGRVLVAGECERAGRVRKGSTKRARLGGVGKTAANRERRQVRDDGYLESGECGASGTAARRRIVSARAYRPATAIPVKQSRR
jgi:hypothetical protein